MTPTITWTNGLTFGIEHLSAGEDNDIEYMIVIHLFLFKICLLKFK